LLKTGHPSYYEGGLPGKVSWLLLLSFAQFIGNGGSQKDNAIVDFTKENVLSTLKLR